MFLDSLVYKAITGGGLLSGEGSFFTSEQLVNLSKLKANGQHRPIGCQQDLWEREFLKIFEQAVLRKHMLEAHILIHLS